MDKLSELSIDDFTKLIVEIIKDIGNVGLNNPDVEETFPIGIVSNPTKIIRKLEDNFPILTKFSITVEWWSDSKYLSMNLFEKANKTLRDYNIQLTSSPIDMYDETTRKHRYGGVYEVNYNGITNSFERIK